MGHQVDNQYGNTYALYVNRTAASLLKFLKEFSNERIQSKSNTPNQETPGSSSGYNGPPTPPPASIDVGIPPQDSSC